MILIGLRVPQHRNHTIRAKKFFNGMNQNKMKSIQNQKHIKHHL